LSYELTPSASGKIILTLHAEGPAAATVAKNSPATKSPAPAVKAPAPAAPSQASTKPVVAGGAKATAVKTPAAKPTVQASTSGSKPPAKSSPAVKVAGPAVDAPAPTPVKNGNASKPKPEEKKWAMSGKRDPFFSPVVQTNGSGCSTGKKCLEIGAINLRGVVRSDAGFIAVVTNNLNKAYFLRENDPVFNGYVVKITGDSVVFQETIQDKLGKSFTREVVKRIITPAV
jgi:hypothetical protein